jgi:hypothetical protein
MKLPVPFEFEGTRIEDFEVKGALAKEIAETGKLYNRGQGYAAIRKWVCSVLQSLGGIEDRTQIESMTREIPFVSAYAAACFGIAETKGTDSVEASYKCPQCGTVRIYAKDEDDDMTDHLYALDIRVAESDRLSFEFDKPVKIQRKDSGESIEEINSLAMRHPTITDFVRGEQRYPDDENALAFFAFGCALLEVNNAEVDDKYRNKFGDLIFAKMPAMTFNKISRAVYENSLGNTIERVCLKCHHRWTAPLNMTNFFSSGLSQ